MAIKPFNYCVLVTPLSKDEIDPVKISAKKAGFELLDAADSNKARAGVDRGIVVEVGPTAWKDYGIDRPCKPGDTVLFTKHAGTAIEDTDGTLYLMLTDQDIYGGVY